MKTKLYAFQNMPHVLAWLLTSLQAEEVKEVAKE